MNNGVVLERGGLRIPRDSQSLLITLASSKDPEKSQRLLQLDCIHLLTSIMSTIAFSFIGFMSTIVCCHITAMFDILFRQTYVKISPDSGSLCAKVLIRGFYHLHLECQGFIPQKQQSIRYTHKVLRICLAFRSESDPYQKVKIFDVVCTFLCRPTPV